LRERFRLVGVIHPKSPGPPIEDYFDEVIAIPPGGFFVSVKGLAEEIVKRQPTVVFHLGVGMVSKIIALASLRLAPIQCVSFGHTATTKSPTMDHYILPEDFVGSADRFSENVLALPVGAFPFVPPRLNPSTARRPPSSDQDGVIRAAVPASTMKLNPHVFRALAAIAAKTKRKVEFQFYPLASRGIAHIYLAAVVAGVLPGATVYPEAPYDVYLGRLAACDLFLCPFPYGNMNSIIDAVSLGLPGVCLDGAEAHSHADAAMFARMNFPAELIAQDVPAYVEAAARLIDDAEWRAKCRDMAAAADLESAFFMGDPSLFCAAIAGLVWPDAKTDESGRRAKRASAG
jgi:predicted O-linked N-acetylglucosamine transferase (SPINDLY family)